MPPYTVIAYPEQGIPTVDLVGSTSTLTWTPRFAAGESTCLPCPCRTHTVDSRFSAPLLIDFPSSIGTKILISVVDAVGNSGGVAQTTYVVGAGTSTACLPASSTSSVQMAVDTTSNTLQTCDTVPIRIQGGSMPYSLTIAVTNSASSVNLTMTASNNYYQWINRAAPSQSLIIAVSDRSVSNLTFRWPRLFASPASTLLSRFTNN